MTAGARRIDVRGPLELTVQLLPDHAQGSDAHTDALIERLPDSSGGAVARFEVVLDGWRFEVSVEAARHAQLREQAARAAAENRPSMSVVLRAQIPGRVTQIWVSAGDTVEQGDRLVAVEAMKMENEVRAPRGGTVTSVKVEVGSLVERDEVLLELA